MIKGEVAWNKGKPWSDEMKKKFSIAHKNPSVETRRKIGLASKGRKDKPETKMRRHLALIKRWDKKGRIGTPERKKQEKRKWDLAHKEHINKYRKKYVKKHYKQILFLSARRRCMRKNAIGTHTLGEWETLKAQFNWICPDCKKQEPDITLTEDHIIPLCKGGSDNIENIQPLCRSCNSKKYTKIINFRERM